MTFTARSAIRDAIVRHARREAPRECCGLLLGYRRRILFALPMDNVAADPTTRFRVDDAAHLEIRRVIRRLLPPLAIIGVYHSHPGGPPVPSPVDIAEAHYPEWIYLIVGLNRARPQLRAFTIERSGARQVRLSWSRSRTGGRLVR